MNATRQNPFRDAERSEKKLTSERQHSHWKSWARALNNIARDILQEKIWALIFFTVSESFISFSF